jgi:hypothetical protein
MINSYLSHPENLRMIADYIIGIDGMFIPGDDQRNKQLMEIALMVSVPVPSPEEIQSGMAQMPAPQPVPVEEIDDNNIHIAVIDAYLVGDRGQELKNSNPIAYQSILMHRQMHEQIIQQQQMAQMEAQANAQGQNQDPNASKPVSEVA